MYIQPITNNAISPSFSAKPPHSSNIFNRALQKVMDAIPDITLKDSASIRELKQNVDNVISKPAQNRLIMGATALITQPAIDYHNHRVDKDTRTVARNRTIAKIIAGTGVGMLVRGSCFKFVEKMTDPVGTGKYSKVLLPEKYIAEFTKNTKNLKNYRNALSTGIAILVMCITNFVLDAPLTTYFTNKFNAKSKAKKEAQEKKEVIYA